MPRTTRVIRKRINSWLENIFSFLGFRNEFFVPKMGLIFGIFYIMSSLLRVMLYEIKIEKIEIKKHGEIEKIKKQPIAMPYIEGQTKVVIAKYESISSQLIRRRKFILERLPFFKN